MPDLGWHGDVLPSKIGAGRYPANRNELGEIGQAGREAVMSSNFASGNATAVNLAQTAQEYVDLSDN
ncbi:MAG: hypothetical protein EON93_10905 [Burkholderiales bacterium]|nr:MAG: hypothetical protein EON93_10905 [Burkholderiales bacterium]